MNWWSRRDASGGEGVDTAAHDAVRLAHRALERFPSIVARHRYVAGGAAVSSALVAMAGVAIALRMRAGQSADDAVAGVTEEEIEGRSRYSIEEDVAEALAQAGADGPAAEEADTDEAGGPSDAPREASVDTPADVPGTGPAAESPRS